MSTKLVKIQEFETEKVVYTIEGVLPLLCHRNPYRANGSQPEKLTDEELFEQALYKWSDFDKANPRYGFLANAVKSSCVDAGRHIPSLSMAELKGLFYVEDQSEGLLELLHPSGEKLVPQIDCQMVIKKNGNSIPVVRARFDEWQIKFVVGYSPSFCNTDTISHTLSVAGELVGLGARRMQKSGQRLYGAFKLV